MLSPEQFRRIAAVIQKQAGIVLGDRNAAMLSSRVDAGIQEFGLTDVDAFYRRIASPAGRQVRDWLIESVTTNETSFFRTPAHFDWLVNEYLPAMRRDASEGRRSTTLSIWSAACSIGAEPYSIAMAIDAQGSRMSGWDVHLLATDLSTRWLEKARRGVYAGRRLKTLPAHYRRYVEPVGDGGADRDGGAEAAQRIKPELRRLVDWQSHNLLDPPPKRSAFDLVWLRNVMIYFDEATRRAVLANVIDSMKPGAFLVVGPTEGIYGMHEPLQKRSTFLYQRGGNEP